MVLFSHAVFSEGNNDGITVIFARNCSVNTRVQVPNFLQLLPKPSSKFANDTEAMHRYTVALLKGTFITCRTSIMSVYRFKRMN